MGNLLKHVVKEPKTCADGTLAITVKVSLNQHFGLTGDPLPTCPASVLDRSGINRPGILESLDGPKHLVVLLWSSDSQTEATLATGDR